MGRRRKRRNPTPLQWGLIAAGAAAVGTGGYLVIRTLAKRRERAQLRKLPSPPITELPTEPPRPEGAGAPGCGVAYPGFVFDGEGCVPTENTPAGIYVGEGCTDFVLVSGEAGPHLDAISSTIQQSASASSDPAAQSADPTSLTTDFFSTFWPECSWPPPPSAPPRIVQLYQAIVYVMGREILDAGGRVLGTSDPDLVDEQIAERLAGFGLPDFDPDVVPEIELPDALSEEAAQVQVAFQ